MKFEKRTTEEIVRREQTEHYSAAIDGYDIIFTYKSQDGGHLQIYAYGQGIELGICDSCPRSVDDLRRFAEVSAGLLTRIADALTEAGFEDLRSDYQKRDDEWEKSYRTLRESLAV